VHFDSEDHRKFQKSHTFNENIYDMLSVEELDFAARATNQRGCTQIAHMAEYPQ